MKTTVVDPKRVKTDDLLTVVHYCKVKDVDSLRDEVLVVDVDRDLEFLIKGGSLLEESMSADQFTETKNVTKTSVAEAFVNAKHAPFTVRFKKSDGRSRTLRGRLVSHENLMGRSMVEDLDIKGNDRLRQVDHRTIEWLVVNGVKYVVK